MWKLRSRYAMKLLADWMANPARNVENERVARLCRQGLESYLQKLNQLCVACLPGRRDTIQVKSPGAFVGFNVIYLNLKYFTSV